MTTPESSENRETVGSGTAESVAAQTQDSVEARALDLLVQASRANPKLREAVAEVEKWIRRLQDDRASAWQSYEEADVEAQWQSGQKLEAQASLWAIMKALDLDPASLGNGWGEGGPKMIYRIEEIVDEGERGFRERDDYKQVLRTIMDVPSQETLLLNAEARAMYELARRAIEGDTRHVG